MGQLRTSTKVPAMAAAAAIAGETRWVRPPRPGGLQSLRLLVEAQRLPGARMSGFMPRHMEHRLAPVKAGLLEDAIEAFLLCLRFNSLRTGTTMAPTWLETCGRRRCGRRRADLNAAIGAGAG